MVQDSKYGFNIFRSRVKLTGKLKLASGLHIGAGRALSPTASDLPVLKDFMGNPFIPGSSFKGVLRSNLESWLRAFDPSCPDWLACDPTDDKSRCISSRMKRDIVNQFGEGADLPLLEQACWVCRLFGSPWAASKIHVLDMKVESDWKAEWLMVRDGVVIDRESETAASGGKYDFEAVPASVEFQFEIMAENPEPYEMGLLALGIDLFNQGFALLGGDTSRGLGRTIIEVEHIHEVTADNLLAKLQPQLEEPEQDIGKAELKEPVESKTQDNEPSDEVLRELITYLGEAGSLDHDGLVSEMQQKGMTKDRLREKGYDNWKKLFERAVKEGLIVESQEGIYHLPGVDIQPTEKNDQEGDEEMQRLEEKKREIARKMEEWKSALWEKLQPQERNLEKKRWMQFREDMKRKEAGANVQSSL